METPEAHPRWGIEFDWLAVDDQQQVALFTSAGYGAVPEAVLRNVALVDEAIDAVAQLPTTGIGKRFPDLERATTPTGLEQGLKGSSPTTGRFGTALTNSSRGRPSRHSWSTYPRPSTKPPNWATSH
jgi:hypothetical protein